MTWHTVFSAFITSVAGESQLLDRAHIPAPPLQETKVCGNHNCPLPHLWVPFPSSLKHFAVQSHEKNLAFSGDGCMLRAQRFKGNITFAFKTALPSRPPGTTSHWQQNRHVKLQGGELATGAVVTGMAGCTCPTVPGIFHTYLKPNTEELCGQP